MFIPLTSLDSFSLLYSHHSFNKSWKDVSLSAPKGPLLILSQVEWVQQQVVKRRTKRDYKPSYPGPVPYSMVQSSSIYFNDAKWSSMWYIVSILNQHAVHRSSELLTLKYTEVLVFVMVFTISYCKKKKKRLSCSELKSLTKV